MKLILTRHGETEENKKGIMQGHLPGKLSIEGIAQAKKLARRLKNEHIDIIYSSDLARASDTTKEIIKYHKTIPVHYTKELRERNLGEYQGKNKSEFNFNSLTWPEPKEGETTKQSHYRAKKFLKYLIEKYPNKTVLCIAHNGINKALINSIIKKDYTNINKMKNYGNTSITVYNITPKKRELEIDNCMKHLESKKVIISE
jgi:probable phosphoglycerate mutase